MKRHDRPRRCACAGFQTAGHSPLRAARAAVPPRRFAPQRQAALRSPSVTPRRRARIRAAAAIPASGSIASTGGTSRATTLPRRVMTTSSPASTQSSNCPNLFFASKAPTCLIFLPINRLAYSLDYSKSRETERHLSPERLRKSALPSKSSFLFVKAPSRGHRIEQILR
jgi:hypothetical protein